MEQLADLLDVATARTEAEIQSRLAQQRQSMLSTEDPDEDDQGNRYCLDCAEIIPPARVQAVAAVRCVHCAGLRERGKRFWRDGAPMLPPSADE